ncbi:MAG TPA: DUF1993 domain-containing protein [Bdellovibrionota bacterium]|jgi:hypothetical protein|nr:DUF1993 domain-containing protein [Bdellovibrionota bacterium]
MLYTLMVPQFTQMLRNLSHILDKGAEHAQAKKIDMEVLLGSRIIADQFPLGRQIQIACDTAKISVSRVTGKDAPVHEDKEKTLPEFKARIDSVISYLNGFSEADFRGAEERKVVNPRWNGKHMLGAEYAVQHAIPNLYFHVTTAYAILRQNGVNVGKKDYLGELALRS